MGKPPQPSIFLLLLDLESFSVVNSYRPPSLI